MFTRPAVAALSAAWLLSACQHAPADVPAAGGSAWFGTWSLRAEDAKGDPETLIYSDAGNGAMRMESVEAGSVLVTRFDGRPAPDIGAKGANRALAVTANSPTRYTWVFWSEGRPLVQGVNTLAPDGRSFTERSWPVENPDKVFTLVYEKR